MTMTRPTSEQITHNGQILKDVLGPVYTLTAFGAKGDGVTDDMDALIAAVNAVKSTGGTLYIPVTANGYYLRYGISASLTGAVAPVSIVSDGATLKLQGGTGIAVPVIGGNFLDGVTIRGLRFVSASTVTRYQNGGPSGLVHFDPEVVAGRADINEQTSFRYGLSFAGGSSNITVDDCYFGTGIFEGIDIKPSGLPGTSTNVRLTNLTFVGVNGQCMLLARITGLTISNIVSIDHPGCGFDWTFYFNSDCKDITMTNVRISCNPSMPFKFGGIQFTGTGLEDLAMSSVVVDGITDQQGFYLGTMTRGTIGSIVIRGCNIGLQSIFATDVCIDNAVFQDCPTALDIAGSNLSISNFSIVGSTTRAITFRNQDMDVRISRGSVIDWNGVTAAFATGAGTAVRRILLSDIDFVFTTYVPTLPCVDARGTTTFVDVINCRARSLFGTASSGFPHPFQAVNAVMKISGCRAEGYAVPIAYPFVTNVAVEQLPPLELTLAANSATPSVLNGVLFVTANSSATAYTNFTDGVQGQEICIRVNDANTTFDFTGTNLKGRNGVDYTATSGDVIFAKRIGSNWYCTVVEA